MHDFAKEHRKHDEVKYTMLEPSQNLVS